MKLLLSRCGKEWDGAEESKNERYLCLRSEKNEKEQERASGKKPKKRGVNPIHKKRIGP